ncbi:hypothetical protein AB0H43_25245 [Hamadaea sp. NPDC050747]|uniref:hypothetical protein n=1 Tax=Hamadaea sp. NPDC050747 TaxID=3155789 RepID=UPI00340686BC
MTVKTVRLNRRPIRIWIPVLPVLLVLSPAIVLAVGVAAVACLVYRINLLRALGSGWRIVSALPGTRLGIEHGRTEVLVTIR